VSTGTGGADGLHHRFLNAHRLDHAVRAKPTREVLDRGDAVVAAVGADLGGTELVGQVLAALVAGERDDACGAKLLGREHSEQANSPVTDNGDGLAGLHAGRGRAEPPGAQMTASVG
jgi:hypothetical protein